MFEPCMQTSSATLNATDLEIMLDYKLFASRTMQLDQNNNNSNVQYPDCIMNNNSVEQPDPDNIKMFVGQVPHDMDENDLRMMFEEYGRVHQINILRDKITGSHRDAAEESKAKHALVCALLFRPAFLETTFRCQCGMMEVA